MIFMLAGLAFGLFCLLALVSFVIWAAREHHFANKYREVLRVYNEQSVSQPTVAGWSVVYKDKEGKKQTVMVPGTMDESMLLKELVKLKIPVTKILSTTRVG